MSHAKSPAACAEFPNDNRALHLGSIWTCADTCEPASVERPAGWRPAAPTGLVEEAGEFAADDEDAWAEDIEIVDELSFEGEVFEEVPAFPPATVAVEAAPELEPVVVPPEPPVLAPAAMEEAPSAPDPFASLVDRLAEVARVAGGETPARAVRWLLGSTPASGCPPRLQPSALEALAAARYVDATDADLRRGDAFDRTVAAWREVLRGETDDLSACGSATLDEWSADLVARLLGQPTRTAGLRQDLRRRGVAAFGLLDDGV